MFDVLEADIVVMQETKIQRKDLRDDMVLVPGWDCFFSLPKHKKGMSRPHDPATVLTKHRLLGGRHLHKTIQVRAVASRRGHHRHAMSAKLVDML